METLDKKITQEEKQKSDLFKFFLNKINDNKDTNFFNESLSKPKLPLIGLYINDGYTYGKILGLTMLTYNILQGEKKDQIINKNFGFEPPKQITNYLNINEEIRIKYNVKAKGKRYFFPQERVNFHLIFSTLPAHNIKQNQYYDITFNLVPHVFLLGENDKLTKEGNKIFYDYPICIFDTSPYGTTVLNPPKFKERWMKLNDLRLEFSEIIFKENELIFAPKNLLFRLNKNEDLSQFYIVMCSPEHKCHNVFYYVVSHNENTNKKMENILVENKTLEGVIKGMQREFGESSKDVVDNLNWLFRI